VTRRRLWLAVRVLVTLGAVAWVASRISVEDAVAAFRAAPAWVFAVPPVLMLGNACLHALRLQLLFWALGDSLSFGQCLAALLKSSFIGLVLPTGGGEVAKVGFLSRHTAVDRAAVVLTASRMQDLLPWAGFLVYGLLWGLLAHDRVLGLAAAVFATAFLVVPLSAWWIAARPMKPPWAWLEKPVRAVRVLRGQTGTLAVTGILALPFAFVNAACAWIVIEAHGVSMPVVDALALIPAADTLISLPITVAGVGVREGVFVRLLGPYGALEATAVAVGLTRWLGELTRASIGAVLWLASDRRGGPP